MLTPEQAAFLIANPEIREMASSLRKSDCPETALRYVKRMMRSSRKGAYFRADLSPAQQKIVKALQKGPRTREQLIRGGISRESVEKYLVSLQRKGLIVAWRSPAGHPPIYSLAQAQEARA